MKRLSGLLLLVLLAGCSDQKFTDVMTTAKSPDGAITAAHVVEAHGPMAGVFYGIPRSGEIVLVAGEDNREFVYHWADSETLIVRLPCGWWSYLTNHYQLPGTARIIDVKYSPPEGCTPQLPASLPMVADDTGARLPH